MRKYLIMLAATVLFLTYSIAQAHECVCDSGNGITFCVIYTGELSYAVVAHADRLKDVTNKNIVGVVVRNLEGDLVDLQSPEKTGYDAAWLLKICKDRCQK